MKDILFISPEDNSPISVVYKKKLKQLVDNKVNVLWKTYRTDFPKSKDHYLDKVLQKNKKLLLNPRYIILNSEPKDWDYILNELKIELNDKDIIGRLSFEAEKITSQIVEIIDRSKINKISVNSILEKEKLINLNTKKDIIIDEYPCFEYDCEFDYLNNSFSYTKKTIKNILYISSYGTSGYAISAQNYIFKYLLDGHNVTFISNTVDNSIIKQPNIINQKVEECINKFYDYYDLFILNACPDSFEYIYKIYQNNINNDKCKIILQTVWETDKIHPDWVTFCNNSLIDEIWLPSEFNKKTFEECGVTKKIIVNKYLSYNLIQSENKENILIPYNIKYKNCDLTKTYNFYYIAVWDDRKNNINTIKTFCETFTDSDNVAFLMKTNYYSYEEENIYNIRYELESLLDNYPNHAPIVIFPNNYSNKQINYIHNLGDCYFLLHRGEGLGYASYDAYLSGKPVIVTKFGGHVEYFYPNYPFFIDYKLTKVLGLQKARWYQHDHNWAEPNYEDAKFKLRQVYEQFKK